MKWNDHLELGGRHAILSPSKYSWLNYDSKKLDIFYEGIQARPRGTAMHRLAEEYISGSRPMPRSNNDICKKLYSICNEMGLKHFDMTQTQMRTVRKYVGDSIKHRMTPEVYLKYSECCYGTTDAISFENGVLRINDLKTGSTPASFKQLHVYAALFCLEYSADPYDIDIILRIYKDGDYTEDRPEADLISDVMANIVRCSEEIESLIVED